MQYDIQEGIKGLIFDLDGTLADTMPYHFQGWKKACEKYGAEIDNNFLRKHTGSPSWIVAREVLNLYGLNDRVTVQEIMNEKHREFFRLQHLVKPITPVTDIVKKHYGILPMAVGTGGHREAVERTLKITGLTEYFDIVITANDVNAFKPDPETFLKCAELMNVSPGDIEVFEDGELGIQAALSAGMKVTDVRSWYDSDW